jgi:hypothetical protein
MITHIFIECHGPRCQKKSTEYFSTLVSAQVGLNVLYSDNIAQEKNQTIKNYLTYLVCHTSTVWTSDILIAFVTTIKKHRNKLIKNTYLFPKNFCANLLQTCLQYIFHLDLNLDQANQNQFGFNLFVQTVFHHCNSVVK